MRSSRQGAPAVGPYASGLTRIPVNRRTVLKAAGYGAIVTSVPFLTSACGSGTSIRFEETKPEVIPYFDKLVSTFNGMKTGVNVTHDSTTSLIASFVRGNPPDTTATTTT